MGLSSVQYTSILAAECYCLEYVHCHGSEVDCQAVYRFGCVVLCFCWQHTANRAGKHFLIQPLCHLSGVECFEDFGSLAFVGVLTLLYLSGCSKSGVAAVDSSSVRVVGEARRNNSDGT